MNYNSESLLFEFNQLIESNKVLFEQMHGELKLLLESQDTLSVLMEAEGNKTGVLRRIVNFIKSIISKFSDKANIITKNNEKFVANNEKLLQSDAIGTLNIKLTPYWKQKKTGQVLNEISTKVDSIVKKRGSEGLDIEKLKKIVASPYLNSDGNLTTGLKNYFRTGDPNKSELKIDVSGSELKKVVNNHMIPFIKDYKSTTTPEINEINRRFNTLLGIAENEERSRKRSGAVTKEDDSKPQEVEVKPTKESVGLVLFEGYPLVNTEFASYHNFQVLTEAKENTNTKVESEKYKTEEERNTSQTLKKTDDSTLKIYTNCMKILQTVAANILTILEEKNATYMNALKAIVSSVKSDKNDTSDKMASSKVDKTI